VAAADSPFIGKTFSGVFRCRARMAKERAMFSQKSQRCITGVPQNKEADRAGIRVTGLWLDVTRLVSNILVFVFFVCPAAAESAFYSQCHKSLPIADEFAQECLKRARPFSRTFYPSGGNTGEVESYSAYFQSLDAPSHFVLGCVLDFKHNINFAGLFYSPQPLDMSRFAESKIVFIDPNDNVGLEIDGARNTLIAVRQFVTGVVPPRLTGRPKNCEDAHIETIDGAIATAHDRFRKIDKTQIEYCSGDYCQVGSYSTFFGAHEVPIVYAEYDLFLIDGDGVLRIKAGYYEKACSTWKGGAAGAYNIIFEMCPKADRSE
jgi:hypothetical protein